MRFFFSTFVVTALFICTLPAFAADKFTADLEATRAVYLKATDGDKRKVRKAIKSTRKLHSKYPKRPLTLIYKGGALAMRGVSISKRPLDRMRETEEGLTTIDRALRKLPNYKGDYLEIVEGQLVAAFLFINLPDSIFHRLKEGSHIVKQLLAHPKLAQMPQGLRAAIYLAAAIRAEKHKQPEDYKHYLELSIQTDPDGKNAIDAQARLNKLTD